MDLSYNLAIATIIALTCAYTDFKTMKIYNVVVYPAAILGLITVLITQRYDFLAGALVVFACYFLFFMTGKLGGGDLKLAVTLTLFIGMQPVLYGTLVSAVIMALWGSARALVNTRDITIAANVILGKIPGGSVPFGLLMGPTSVMFAIII